MHRDCVVLENKFGRMKHVQVQEHMSLESNLELKNSPVQFCDVLQRINMVE